MTSSSISRAKRIQACRKAANMTKRTGVMENPKFAAQRRVVYRKAQEDTEIRNQQTRFPELSKRLLPQFALSEVTLGPALGKGVFGTVFEIRALSTGNGGIKQQGKEEREFLSQHCLRQDSGDARYAIKLINPEISCHPEVLYQAVVDSATEAHFLSSLEHPHIIKLRALNSGDMFCDGAFLIMDRLYHTLQERLDVWDRHMKRCNGILGKILPNRNTGGLKETVWEQRLVAATNVCSALSYLHSHQIIHRDVKPENIGFDIRDDIKIFDFGMARELPTNDNNGVYKMTSCGTARYMAPEIARKENYNETCDVYSFSILLWEILSLKVPFGGKGMTFFRTNVWRGKQSRPKIDPTWSDSIQQILSRGWNADITDRPGMCEVLSCLREECISLKGGDISGIDSHRRRSTFVFEKEKMEFLDSGSSTFYSEWICTNGDSTKQLLAPSTDNLGVKDQSSLSSSVAPMRSRSKRQIQVSRAA